MSTIVVDIFISADEYLKHYQVAGAIVMTKSRDGRRVQFPASILQRYVTHQGIDGSFEITFDSAGKFSGIRRLR